MKVLGFIGLLIGGLILYGYFFDHTFLRNVGLGVLISADASKADDDRAAQAREAAIESNRSNDGGGLVKCVDANGNTTFTQGACAGGGTGHSVQLHETEILHTGGGNQGNGSSSSQQSQSSSGQTITSHPEDQKHNAMGAINEKFLPQ